MRALSSKTFKEAASENGGMNFAQDASKNKVIFKLQGDEKPEVKWIQSDNVLGLNSKKEKVVLRYSKNEATQEKQKQKIDFVDRIGITFQWGQLIVDKNIDPNKVSFLRMHGGNRANGGRSFYEYNPLAESVASTDRDDAVMDAKAEIRKKLKTDTGIAQLRQVSRGLRFPSYNGSIAVLKADLYMACNDDPNAVLEAFDDKVIKAKAYIGICMDEGELIHRNNGVYWAGAAGKTEKLLTIATGRDVIDETAMFAVQPVNFEFYKEIEKIALKSK